MATDRRIAGMDADSVAVPKPTINKRSGERTMRSHSLWVLGTFAGLALAGCATHGTSQRYADQASLATSPVDAELMSYRIRNWTALNDHELMLESMDGQRYRAETLGPCFGLNSAARLGFENRGGFQQVDRFS